MVIALSQSHCQLRSGPRQRAWRHSLDSRPGSHENIVDQRLCGSSPAPSNLVDAPGRTVINAEDRVAGTAAGEDFVWKLSNTCSCDGANAISLRLSRLISLFERSGRKPTPRPSQIYRPGLLLSVRLFLSFYRFIAIHVQDKRPVSESECPGTDAAPKDRHHR